MKIYCNDKEIFEISEVDRSLLEHDLLEVDAEIERRLEYIIKHKVDQCFMRFKKEWDEKLAKDPAVNSVPAKRDDYVNFVKARADYKNRAQRDAESGVV